MARDFLGPNSPKNFARGDYPPYDSYEWAGVPIPPNTPVHLRPKSVVKKPGGLWGWVIGIGLMIGGVRILGRGVKMLGGSGGGGGGGEKRNLLLPRG